MSTYTHNYNESSNDSSLPLAESSGRRSTQETNNQNNLMTVQHIQQQPVIPSGYYPHQTNNNNNIGVQNKWREEPKTATHTLPIIATPIPPKSAPHRYEYPNPGEEGSNNYYRYNNHYGPGTQSHIPEYRPSFSWACCCHYTTDFFALSLVIGFMVFAGYICYYVLSNGG